MSVRTGGSGFVVAKNLTQRLIVGSASWVLLACGSVGPGAQSHITLADLEARPVSLPVLPAGSACPSSTQVPILPGRKLPGYGFGSGHVYLSGQTEWNDGVGADIFVSSDYLGPVVVRGHRLDGPGGFPLVAASWRGLMSTLGVSTSEKSVEISAVDQSPPEWRRWVGVVHGAPGCYALQADLATTAESIYFQIHPGPPLPG